MKSAAYVLLREVPLRRSVYISTSNVSEETRHPSLPRRQLGDRIDTARGTGPPHCNDSRDYAGWVFGGWLAVSLSPPSLLLMGSLQAVRVHRWLHRIASPTNPLGERQRERARRQATTGYTFGKRRPFSAIYVNSLEDEERRGEEGAREGLAALATGD